MCVSAGDSNKSLASLQGLSNQQSCACHSPGCSKVTLILLQSRGVSPEVPRHCISSVAALWETLRNGLFWICISFASHMGSVFPFSLFFLIAFFLVIIISISLPSPLHFSQLALIGFSAADAPSDPEEGAKVLFLFIAGQPCQRAGGGWCSQTGYSLLWPQPASCASGEVCQIAR